MTTTEMSTPQHQHHEYLCDECEMEIAEHDFVGASDIVWRLCAECNKEAKELVEDMQKWEQEQDEEEEAENLGMCVSCEEKPAKIVFMHLTNGNFELCIRCFEWADHERDYGEDFGVSSSEDDGDY